MKLEYCFEILNGLQSLFSGRKGLEIWRIDTGCLQIIQLCSLTLTTRSRIKEI